MPAVTKNPHALSTGAVGAARTRYSLERSIPTMAGGRVGVGAMAGKADSPSLLVHTDIPSRGEQSIDLGAVATAVTHGAIPYAELIACFAQEGTLAELEKALAAFKSPTK